MRPKFQARIISTHIEILQETITQLEAVVLSGKKAVETGQFWLEEKEEIPRQYSELQLLLTDEISLALQKCSEIAKHCEDIVEPVTRSPSTQFSLKEFLNADIQSYNETGKDPYFIALEKKLEDFISSCKEKDEQSEASRIEFSERLQTLQNVTANSDDQAKGENLQACDIMTNVETKVNLLSQRLDGLKEEFDLKTEEFSATLKHLKENMENIDQEQKTNSDQDALAVFNSSGLGSKFKEECFMDLQKYKDYDQQTFAKIQDVESIRRNLYDLGQSIRTIGFTAKVPFVEQDSKVMNHHPIILNCFKEIHCNVGGHYNPITGIFTAPCSGLYLISLGVTLLSNHQAALSVWKVNNLNKQWVTTAGSSGLCTSGCVVELIAVNFGEQIYVTSTYCSGNYCLSKVSYFSCFMISRL